MRILWLCNIVLPVFSDEFNIRKSCFGGWMSGMLNELTKDDDIRIGVCCPIYDDGRARDGVFNNLDYYSFHFFTDNDYHDETRRRFAEIISDFRPDIVHIWGTEYPHSLAMVNACKQMDMSDRVIINIQGLVSVYAKHYFADMQDEYIDLESDGYRSVRHGRDEFVLKGKYEIEAIKNVRRIIGRTDWDKACVTQINPNADYRFCGEILRDIFYKNVNKWSYEKCDKHTIFVSQCVYPIKGFHHLLKALPEIIREFPDVRVRVGGYNITEPDAKGNVAPYGIYINDLMNGLDLSHRIEFLGNLTEEQMLNEYLNANVFVCASSIENSSNSLCEAALCGVPIVSSFTGGTMSMFSESDKFLFYQHDADYMLSFCIQELFAQSKFEDCAASETASDLNSKEKNSAILRNIYKSVLQEAP